jgi:hypothetical protein
MKYKYFQIPEMPVVNKRRTLRNAWSNLKKDCNVQPYFQLSCRAQDSIQPNKNLLNPPRSQDVCMSYLFKQNTVIYFESLCSGLKEKN